MKPVMQGWKKYPLTLTMKAAFSGMWWSGIRPAPDIIRRGCWWTRFIGPGKNGITVKSAESVCPG